LVDRNKPKRFLSGFLCDLCVSVVRQRFFLFAASLALTVELHPVVKDVKPVALRDPVLEGFEGVILKFNDLPTAKANEMIVMLSVGHPFVPNFSVVKPSLGCEPKPG
jgi:hypothetical protein